MYVQILTFDLEGTARAEFQRKSEAEAARLARTPGLLQTVWLGDEAENTFGGVYVWANRQAMERYLDSEAFRAVAADPSVKRLESRAIEALEAPTSVTSLLFELAA